MIPSDDRDDLRDFLEIVYRALMLIVRWLRRRYGFGRGDERD